MNDLRTAAQQVLEAMRCGVPTGRITLYAWDKALSDLDAALAQEKAEPVGAAGLLTLAHLWAQQAYFKGLGRPCDIDGARGAFEQALKAQERAEPAADSFNCPKCGRHDYGLHGACPACDAQQAALAQERAEPAIPLFVGRRSALEKDK